MSHRHAPLLPLLSVVRPGFALFSATLLSLVVPSVLALSLTACQGAAKCTSSAQCANGFACNTESQVCEELAPDASPPADAAPACPADTHFCAAPAPEGWSGPVIGAKAGTLAELAACPAEFATEEKLVASELAVAGECSCDCPGIAAGVLCSDAVISAVNGTSVQQCNAICAGGCATALKPDATCAASLDSDITAAPAVRVSLGKIQNSGTCGAAIESNNFAAEFAEQARYCSGSAIEASCPASGECLPVSSDASYDSVCIFQAGDQECPAEYSEKTLRFEGLTDDRSCSSCSCSGPAVNSSCGGQVSIFSGTASPCGGSATVLTATCTAKTAAQAITAKWNPAATFDCSLSSGGVESGEAAATDPVTFCCLPASL